MASIQPSTAFDRIPGEIWKQIAQTLPASSLPNFVLSSRIFYRCANPYLYRTVFFLGTTKSSKEGSYPNGIQEWCFGIHGAQSWLSYPHYSSPIIHLKLFLETITTRPKLRSYITGASFEWDDTADAQDILIAKRCLEYLNPSLSLLRLALPDFDPKFAITSNVTFLEIEYPNLLLLTDGYIGSQYDVDLHKGLRDSVYSIFCIPTLRHFTLKDARTWDAFTPRPTTNYLRVGTSNIISLSLLNTVPLSRDLEEMLTWPKALRHIYHESAVGLRNTFQNYQSEHRASPGVFIKGLYTQRHTIEELIYNNGKDDSGSDGTTFGMALREFVNLKRLVVSRDSLIGDWEDGEPQPLSETLPPNLEEAWILLDYEAVEDDQQLSFLKQWLQEIAINKTQYCPSLRSLVLLGESEDWLDVKGFPEEEARVLDALNLFSIFQEVGIRFDFTFGIPVGFGDMYLMDGT